MSQETWTKRKSAARHTGASPNGGGAGRRWNVKPSILANQKVDRRIRKNNTAMTRVGETMPALQRKQRPWPSISGKAVGLWALEGSVFLVVGLSVLAKNGLETLINMFRFHRDANDQYDLLPESGDHFFDDCETQTLASAPSWPEDTHEIRTNVEEQKVNTLTDEEIGLSSEVLDDQAGALRSLVSEYRG
ncbi:MAG: hypothetical protein HQL73_12780 [Magnetococcales bacterium]|nr:hypothetical protein [Magnetococcales bacterium]